MDGRKAVHGSRPVSYAASRPGLLAALLVSNVCVVGETQRARPAIPSKLLL